MHHICRATTGSTCGTFPRSQAQFWNLALGQCSEPAVSTGPNTQHHIAIATDAFQVSHEMNHVPLKFQSREVLALVALCWHALFVCCCLHAEGFRTRCQVLAGTGFIFSWSSCKCSQHLHAVQRNIVCL